MERRETQYLRKDLSISENIIKLRKKADMKQKDVAIQLQLMGIKMSRSHFSGIEVGRLNISVGALVALKTIFKCEYADFFEGLDEKLLELREKLEE